MPCVGARESLIRLLIWYAFHKIVQDRDEKPFCLSVVEYCFLARSCTHRLINLHFCQILFAKMRQPSLLSELLTQGYPEYVAVAF